MKSLVAVGFFVLEAILLSLGVIKAVAGSPVILVVALVLMAGAFIKFGCIDNAPDAH